MILFFYFESVSTFSEASLASVVLSFCFLEFFFAVSFGVDIVDNITVGWIDDFTIICLPN